MSLGLGIGMLSRRGPYRVGSVSHPIFDALTAYWELDEQSNGSAAVPRLDSHTGGYDLTDVNTVTSVTESWGEVAAPNGANSEYFYGSTTNTIINFQSTQTVFFWVYVAVPSTTQMILSKHNISPYRNWQIFIQSSAIVFNVADGTNQINRITSPTITASTWYFVVCALDSSTMQLKMWLNNTAVTPSSIAQLPANSQIPLYVAGRQGDGLLPFTGRMAGVGAVTGLLSSASLTWLYSAGRPRTYAEIQSYTG